MKTYREDGIYYAIVLPTVYAIGETNYFFHGTGAYVVSTTATSEFLPEDAITASRSELVWALIDRITEATLMACHIRPISCTSGIPKCVALQVLDEGFTLSSSC